MRPRHDKPKSTSENFDMVFYTLTHNEYPSKKSFRNRVAWLVTEKRTQLKLQDFLTSKPKWTEESQILLEFWLKDWKHQSKKLNLKTRFKFNIKQNFFFVKDHSRAQTNWNLFEKCLFWKTKNLKCFNFGFEARNGKIPQIALLNFDY